MPIKDLILGLVDKQKIRYETIQAPDAVSLKEDWLESTVPLNSACQFAFLQDELGTVVAIYPANRVINLPDLRTTMGRQLHFVPQDEILEEITKAMSTPDFDLSKDNTYQFIADEYLTNQDVVHIEGKNECSLIRLDAVSLEQLSDNMLVGCSFSDAQEEPTPSLRKQQLSVQERLKKIDRLPAMPEMPSRILAIRNNPNSSIDDLVEVVSMDISLSAQIIRYANSAMFRTNEPVDSLKDAIFRVLGYETVLHLSLGYALGRVFKLPENGPLGHDAFWRHSTFSAALAQHLASAMPRNLRPKPGIAYLAGLLHDIGFLVLNMFFKNEHAWLNKMIAANPNKSIVEMENRLLGISHTELGNWLMKDWEMPEELITTIQHHHNLAYDGPHAEYALLLNLTERLLKTHGMSDCETDEIPAELLERLGLDEEEVIEITDEVLQGGETLNEMACSISA